MTKPSELFEGPHSSLRRTFDAVTMKDHRHCFNEDTPPCGLPGRHRCCLCNEPVPSLREEFFQAYSSFRSIDKQVDFFISKHNADIQDMLDSELLKEEEQKGSMAERHRIYGRNQIRAELRGMLTNRLIK